MNLFLCRDVTLWRLTLRRENNMHVNILRMYPETPQCDVSTACGIFAAKFQSCLFTDTRQIFSINFSTSFTEPFFPVSLLCKRASRLLMPDTE